MNRLIPILSVCVLFTCTVFGMQSRDASTMDALVGWNAGAPFAGRCVVRVRTTSQDQLDRVLKIVEDVWSERIGQGLLDIDVRVVDLSRLDAIGVPYDVLIEDLQAHADAHEQDMMRVRRAQLEQRPEGYQRGGQVHDDAWFETYRTLDEITEYMNNVAMLRPDLATIEVIGQSWEGRDMFSITISGVDTEANPIEDRPALFIFSTVHAREWIAPMTTSYIASKLVAEYDADEHARMLLDRARVVVVPVGNPDGYVYTWSDERFWRKTRRDNGDGRFGVDINRNWGLAWGGEGSSRSTSSNTYRGELPFSEPETRALRDVAIGLGDSLVGHIDYHAYGRLILWPYGFSSRAITPAPFDQELIDVATCMAHTISDTTGVSYTPMQSIDLYPAAGTSKDWFFGVMHSISYTLELGTSFAAPTSQILPTGMENYEAFKVLIEKSVIRQRYLHEPKSERDRFDERRVDVYSMYQSFNTGEMFVRVDGVGDFDSIPMVSETDHSMSGLIPEVRCGGEVEYYFEMTGHDGSVTTLPEEGASSAYGSMMISKAYTFADSCERDLGWIAWSETDPAGQGEWERADPEGTVYQPEFDRTLDGEMCWVTDARGGGDDDFDVDGGSVYLDSPRFSALDDSVLSFWFWQNPSPQLQDVNRVGFSNDDGVTWVYPPYLRSETPGVWTPRTYLLSDYLEPTNTMRVRFSARDVRDDSTVELAIDDIAVGVPGCPANAADINADGLLDIFDVSKFIEFFSAESISADYNGDLEINFFDVAAYLQIFLGG